VELSDHEGRPAKAHAHEPSFATLLQQ